MPLSKYCQHNNLHYIEMPMNKLMVFIDAVFIKKCDLIGVIFEYACLLSSVSFGLIVFLKYFSRHHVFKSTWFILHAKPCLTVMPPSCCLMIYDDTIPKCKIMGCNSCAIFNRIASQRLASVQEILIIFQGNHVSFLLHFIRGIDLFAIYLPHLVD